MTFARILRLLIVLGAACVAPALRGAAATQTVEERLDRLERRISRTDAVVSVGIVSAAICALWAQNTGRNAWLWFFAGLIFSALTLLVMLYKNAQDLSARRGHPGGPQPPSQP